MGKSENGRGFCLMLGVTLSKEYKLQSDFSEIIKKAYEKGISDDTITIQKLIEDIKLDLQKVMAD